MARQRRDGHDDSAGVTGKGSGAQHPGVWGCPQYYIGPGGRWAE